MASKLKTAAGAFERLMLPRLDSIDGELKGVNTRIDATNARIDSAVASLGERIESVEKRQDSLRSELLAEMRAGFAEQNAKIDKLGTTVEGMAKEFDTQRELAILKTKVAELEKRR